MPDSVRPSSLRHTCRSSRGGRRASLTIRPPTQARPQSGYGQDPAHPPTHPPSFFIAHGDNDTVVIVDDARAFVNHLRKKSTSPVVYAELPGAQHVFDLFHSIRFESVVDAIERYAAAITARSSDADPDTHR